MGLWANIKVMLTGSSAINRSSVPTQQDLQSIISQIYAANFQTSSLPSIFNPRARISHYVLHSTTEAAKRTVGDLLQKTNFAQMARDRLEILQHLRSGQHLSSGSKTITTSNPILGTQTVTINLESFDRAQNEVMGKFIDIDRQAGSVPAIAKLLVPGKNQFVRIESPLKDRSGKYFKAFVRNPKLAWSVASAQSNNLATNRAECLYHYALAKFADQLGADGNPAKSIVSPDPKTYELNLTMLDDIFSQNKIDDGRQELIGKSLWAYGQQTGDFKPYNRAALATARKPYLQLLRPELAAQFSDLEKKAREDIWYIQNGHIQSSAIPNAINSGLPNTAVNQTQSLNPIPGNLTPKTAMASGAINTSATNIFDQQGATKTASQIMGDLYKQSQAGSGALTAEQQATLQALNSPLSIFVELAINPGLRETARAIARDIPNSAQMAALRNSFVTAITGADQKFGGMFR